MGSLSNGAGTQPQVLSPQIQWSSLSIPWGIPALESEKAKQISQGHNLLCLLQGETVSGFPEKQRNKAASLALL